MRVEKIETPKTVKELEELSKDETVFILYNVYSIIKHMYERANKIKEANELDFSTCFKLKPLHLTIKKSDDPYLRLNSIFVAVNTGAEKLIRIY